MADAWLPGAGQMQTKYDGGSLQGGAPRTVWHTSETDPRMISARSVAQRLEQTGRAAHLVWNPRDGDIVQMIPATRAAQMLDGAVDREGRVCIQIVVVAHAREPFTAFGMKGLDTILEWLDSWRVPRRWPAGSPLPSPQAYHSDRSRRLWAGGGHFGRSQVPQTTGPDPGAVDIEKLTGIVLPRVPRPREAPGAQDAEPGATRARLLRQQAASAPPAAEREPASSRL